MTTSNAQDANNLNASNFAAFGGRETRTHDVLIPADRLTSHQAVAILGLESCGASPSHKGKDILVPCFFRPYAAAILAQ